jgi:hypothetical protein
MKALPDVPVGELPYVSEPRVDELIRTYFYGDIIHFGEGRDGLEALQVDAFSSASNKMSRSWIAGRDSVV